jgi:hypothetical protein
MPNKNNRDTVEGDSDYDSSSDDDTTIDETNIKNIIFKKIDDKFSYGKYGQFSVILMNKNGYVNATKLCNMGGKKLMHWNENKTSDNLLYTLSKITNIPKDELTIIVHGDNKSIVRGTYVHPKLICPIAQWISSEFTFKVSDIVDEYFIKEAIEEKNKLLKKKDDKIDTLNKKIDMILKDTSKIKQQNKELKKQNIRLEDKQDKMLTKLETVCIDRVVPTGYSKDIAHLLLIKNNIDLEESDSDSDDDIENYEYTVLRIMENSLNTTYSKHKKRYPKCTELLNIEGSPNAIILWKRVKDTLKKDIVVNGSNFNLKKNYTQTKLIKDIKNMHADRLKTDDI